MKILICGDSFSYDHTNENSWVTRLRSNFQVTNLSQCGIGEYKIYQQLKSVDVNNFDKILISHGSPNRLYINQEYALHKDKTHKNSDLIFTDVEDKKDSNWLANLAYNYFINIFDLEYHSYIHNLICQDIDRLTQHTNVLHITHFDYSKLYDFNKKLIEFYDIWMQHSGNINHYTSTGNTLVYKKLIELL